MEYLDVQAVLDAANAKRPKGTPEWTRASLADHIGANKQTLTNYQSGRVSKPITYLAKMAKVSGLSLDKILISKTKK